MSKPSTPQCGECGRTKGHAVMCLIGNQVRPADLPTPVGDRQQCLKCGHRKSLDDPLRRRVLCDVYYEDSARWCGCKCEFAPVGDDDNCGPVAPVTIPYGTTGALVSREAVAENIIEDWITANPSLVGELEIQIVRDLNERIARALPPVAARRAAEEIAEELDRCALLYNTRGDRPLTVEELKPVIDALSRALSPATERNEDAE